MNTGWALYYVDDYELLRFDNDAVGKCVRNLIKFHVYECWCVIWWVDCVEMKHLVKGLLYFTLFANQSMVFIFNFFFFWNVITVHVRTANTLQLYCSFCLWNFHSFFRSTKKNYSLEDTIRSFTLVVLLPPPLLY